MLRGPRTDERCPGLCVGGVGASGGTGEQDIACCDAGIAAFMATLGK